MYRAENKYALSYIDFTVLKRKIAAILPWDHSGDTNGGYKISSLYFDDIYDTHLMDTINGNPVRKNSVSISFEQMKALANGIPIDSPYSMDDPRTEFNMAIKRYKLRPKVIVTYDRSAFIYDSGNIRITFDENLRGSSSIDLFGNSNLTYDFRSARTQS